jgi:hypothetical protein
MNVAVERLALLFHVRTVPGLNICLKTVGLGLVFRNFYRSAGIILVQYLEVAHKYFYPHPFHSRLTITRQFDIKNCFPYSALAFSRWG